MIYVSRDQDQDSQRSISVQEVGDEWNSLIQKISTLICAGQGSHSNANSNVYFTENPSGKSFIHSFYLCDLNVDHVSFNIDLLLDMREVKTAWDL